MQKKRRKMSVMGIVCGLLLLTGCEKIKQEQGNAADTIAFSTSYSIEEYCHGCYIVSEPGEELYGVLDKSGNEILPVVNESVEFLNRETLEEGTEQNLYMKVKQGDEYGVFNEEGKCIVYGDAECISYEVGADQSDSCRFVLDRPQTHTLTFFDKKGAVLSALDYYTKGDEKITEGIAKGNIKAYCTWITEEMYLLQLYGSLYTGDHERTESYAEVTLYNKYGQIIQNWEKAALKDEAVLDSKYVFTIQNANPVIVYTVDENGNFAEEGLLSESKEYMLAGVNKKKLMKRSDIALQSVKGDKAFYLGEKNDIRLSFSDSEYTLTDADGNALYEDSYKECEKQGDYYFLKGKSGKAYLIDKDAKILLDDQYLTWNGDIKWLNGIEITRENFLVGDDGVCFVQNNDDKNNVCFFERK